MSDHCNSGKREGQILLIVLQIIEEYRPVARRRPETNNETTAFAMQWHSKHACTTKNYCWKWCSLLSPC